MISELHHMHLHEWLYDIVYREVSLALLILRHADHFRYAHSIQPPKRRRNRPFRQLPIPLILHLLNLLPIARRVNINHTLNRSLLAHTLNRVLIPQIHNDRVARIDHLVRLDLDGGEDLCETVPLRFELLAALGDGEGVGEGGVVGPEGELGFCGVAGEEV